MFFVVFSPAVFADELPRDVQKLLAESGTNLNSVADWSFSDLWRTVVDWIISGFQPTFRFAAQSAGYLLLSVLFRLLLGKPYSVYADFFATIGFGTLSLSHVMQLTELASATAQDCCTYLTTFVPVYSGIAAAGGQPSGALVYSGMFFAMSGFLASAMQKILLPILQIYFCLTACACLWSNSGFGDAASLFSHCLRWLLKVCGALFSLVLGVQSTLAGVADNAAIKTGKGILQGAIPVVGDAAAAALTGAAAAIQLLKGSLALAALLALAAMFVPVFLQCAACALTFAGAGILAGASGQDACACLCRSYFEGARLCGSMLVLYFFIVLLSTALLLLTGNGGLG